jgi:hypothetical protein
MWAVAMEDGAAFYIYNLNKRLVLNITNCFVEEIYGVG